MDEAPERIWAVTEPDDISADIFGDVYAQQTPAGMVGQPVEYIRADLVRPRVKPLVWERSASFGEVYEAKTIFGEYLCGIDNEGIAYGGGAPNANEWVDYDSVADAKAAAQSDYESRVMSVLV